VRTDVLVIAEHPSLRTVIRRETREVCVLSCGHEVVLWDGCKEAPVVLCPFCEALPLEVA
jgi:hypothetical protein